MIFKGSELNIKEHFEYQGALICQGSGFPIISKCNTPQRTSENPYSYESVPGKLNLM